MLYEEVIKKLSSTGFFRVDLGLDRIKKILLEFDNPQDKLKCIHVAGTNGKGSVCSMLESILRENGYKTGLYTSPHIFKYTERIKISGVDISKEDFAHYFEEVYSMMREKNIDLTEFEILTTMMFLYFERNNVDYVILETGLGGRLDATNVIRENLCSIITQIDLDHTTQLGDTKEKIASEKAGIIKANCPVVTSMGYEVIKDRADELNSMQIFTYPGVNEDFTEALSLKGLHQIENLALVLSCINYCFPQIDEGTIKNGLKKVKNPYRFEFFEDKNLIVDVCHNPNGVEALKNNLDYYFPNQKRRFVFGCLRRKDYKKMMETLFREDDEIYINEFDYPESCTFEELQKVCSYKVQKYTSEIYLPPDKLNIICGSFYMLNGLKEIIK